MNTKQLLDLKKQIDEAKTSMSELRGRRTYLIQQLKKQWDCKDINEANKKLNEMEKEIQKLEKEITKGITDIEEKIND